MPDAAPRILVVDDDTVVREALREELSPSFAVSTAPSAEDGLALMRGSAFEAVVSDVRMPGMGGVAFLWRVAEIDPSIVRVFLTGYGDEEVYECARGTGAFKLKKPWGDELELILHQAIAGRRSRQRLKEESGRMSAVGAMAASVAHDIRTPLAVLAANRQYLRECVLCGIDDPEVEELVQDDGVALDAIQRVLDALRDFAAEPEAGEPVAVFRIIDRSARLVRRRLASSRTELRVCRSSGDITAMTTAVELGQILANLLGNALDASPEDSVVAVDATVEANHVCIRISDDGAGVPAGDEEKIFQPFHSRKSNGMGLGLCISREMARRHGGDLRFMGNDVGARKGACFEVRLPSAPPPAGN